MTAPAKPSEQARSPPPPWRMAEGEPEDPALHGRRVDSPRPETEATSEPDTAERELQARTEEVLRHPLYKAISNEQAASLLATEAPGTCCLRPSSQADSVALSFVSEKKQVIDCFPIVRSKKF